jgi:hypothetical protein
LNYIVTLQNQKHHNALDRPTTRATTNEVDVTKFMWFLRPSNSSLMEPSLIWFYLSKFTKYFANATFFNDSFKLLRIYSQTIALSVLFFIYYSMSSLFDIKADYSLT